MSLLSSSGVMSGVRSRALGDGLARYTFGELQRLLNVADCRGGDGDGCCRTAVGLGT